MSEYQYYEFQAIDRPLSDADRRALRGLSTRARITATSFTNEYHWGDLKGSPVRLMERWFDLHLYLANNASGYDRALELLLDLQGLAQEDGTLTAFSERVRSLRDRHSRKPRFIERLRQLDQQ